MNLASVLQLKFETGISQAFASYPPALQSVFGKGSSNKKMSPQKSESTGRSMKKGSPSTRNSSVGSINLSSGSFDSAEAKVPHYLRASTGSCHDLCKHGYRSTLSSDSTKTKATPHFRASTGSFHDPIKHESHCTGSLEFQSSHRDFCKYGIRSSSEEGVRKDRRVPKISQKKTTVGKSSNTKSGGKTYPEIQEEIIKREVVSVPSSSPLSSPILAKPVKVKLLSTLKGKNNHDAVATRKTTSSKISSKLRSVSPLVKTVVLKGQNNVTHVQTGISKSKMPEKIKHVIDINVKRPTGNEVDEFILKKTVAKGIKTVQHEKKVHRKEVFSSDQKAQESVSNKIGSGKTEKALPPPRSQPSSLSKNLTHAKMIPSSKSNLTKIATTRRVTPSKDKASPSVKLKFRQGTVLNTRPSDNADIPRQLKFRRPSFSETKPDAKRKSTVPANNNRTSGVNAEKQPHTNNLRSSTNSLSNNVVKNRGAELSTRRSSFRKSAAADNKGEEMLTRRLSHKTIGNNKGESSKRRLPLSDKSFSNNRSQSLTKRSTPFKRSGSKGEGGEISSLKLRLKHRSVQKNKITRVLFNSMIEETANKLVEIRKSKVKALVGAFETVIQELCPPTNGPMKAGTFR